MSTVLTLLHTNDMHNCREALQWLREHPPAEPYLLVDVGDSLRGSNTLWYWNEPIIDEMNQLGYAVQAMGNREFHYLRRVLRCRREARRFPILAANLEDVRGQEAFWQSEYVVDMEGIRVGFTGVTPVQYDDDAVWKRLFGFRFLPPVEALEPVLRRLREQCRVVILLSHSGYAKDQELAAALPFDLIIGGHSHTVLQQPTWVGQVPIVQTGSHGRYVGKIHLTVPETGAVGLDYSLIPCRTAA